MQNDWRQNFRSPKSRNNKRPKKLRSRRKLSTTLQKVFLILLFPLLCINIFVARPCQNLKGARICRTPAPPSLLLESLLHHFGTHKDCHFSGLFAAANNNAFVCASIVNCIQFPLNSNIVWPFFFETPNNPTINGTFRLSLKKRNFF